MLKIFRRRPEWPLGEQQVCLFACIRQKREQLWDREQREEGIEKAQQLAFSQRDGFLPPELHLAGPGPTLSGRAIGNLTGLLRNDGDRFQACEWTFEAGADQ